VISTRWRTALDPFARTAMLLALGAVALGATMRRLVSVPLPSRVRVGRFARPWSGALGFDAEYVHVAQSRPPVSDRPGGSVRAAGLLAEPQR
jgi:hypothetical protein